MKVLRNHNNRYLDFKCGSLIINNKKRKMITRNLTRDQIEPNIDNNIHLFCNTIEKQPIEDYIHSDINCNLKKSNKFIYYKNKLKNSLLKKNINQKISSNTIVLEDTTSPTNKECFESKVNKMIISNNTLRKNKTGLQLKKEFFDKINKDYRKEKNNDKSLKNFNNIINLHIDKDRKPKKSFNCMKNKTNKLTKIKNLINKKDEFIQNVEEETINSNRNDDTMPKELLFNLLVKRLNKSIEDNEKDQKIIKKLRDENNKLKQKILLDSKKNEMTIKKQTKELFEMKKNNDILKKENQQLREDMIKLILTIKENQKANNDNMQLNQFDSICSSIGGLSAFSMHSTEKE